MSNDQIQVLRMKYYRAGPFKKTLAKIKNNRLNTLTALINTLNAPKAQISHVIHHIEGPSNC